MVLAEGVAAQWARRAAPAQKHLAVCYHSRGLFTGEGHPRYRARGLARLWAARAGLFVSGCPDLSHNEHNPVGRGVVGELHGPHGPFGLHRLLELQVALSWDCSRARKICQHFAQATCKEQHLVLFQLEGDKLVVLAGLKVKDALARRPYRSDGYPRGARQVEGWVQRRLLVAAPPVGCLGSWTPGSVQLTNSTLGDRPP